MTKLVFSLLAAALVVVGAQAIIKEQCSWIIGKHPFDEERISGLWHVIAVAKNAPEQEPKTCAQYNVTYDKSNGDEKYIVKFTALDKEKKMVSFEGISKPRKSDRRSMFLGVMKKTGSETYDGIYNEAIVATDYDTYAVYVGCKPIFDSTTNEFGRRFVAAVLSRRPTLNEDIKNTLINVLSGYDIEPTNFKTVEHVDCPQ
ncbi:uncharacterized protein [Hetaerina americana]|uniref:uncharacterized protein n=1 Tax=Hetaerina americana TaxID=62018 RepID=UPI003A7F56E6